jgi:protein-arginine kinase activator protein McsA
MHPEIYNSNLDLELKLFLQDKLNELGGNFNDLLNDFMDYAILPEVEDYENAAIIRDYIKEKSGELER